MKACFIGTGLNLLSGSSKPIYQLMQTLEEKGYKSKMISDPLEGPLLSINSMLEKKYNYNNLNIDRIDKNMIYAILKNEKNIVEDIYGCLQDYDIVICTDFIFSWILKKFKRNCDIPLVFLASNNLNFKMRYLYESGLSSMPNILKPGFFIKSLLPKKIMAIILSEFNQILATSSFVMRSMDFYDLGIPIAYLPIGIESPPSLSQIKGTYENNFSYFGWGSGIRGLQDVAEAFKDYKIHGGNARLKICLQGQHGYEENFFKKKISKSNISAYVDICSFSEDIEKEILLSRVIILPFRVPFGYSQPPLTVLEGMRLGRAVISTNIGSVPEYISNGIDGFLVNPASPKDISTILLRLDDDSIDEIGYNAYLKMKKHYDWNRLAYIYISKFKEIINGTNRS